MMKISKLGGMAVMAAVVTVLLIMLTACGASGGATCEEPTDTGCTMTTVDGVDYALGPDWSYDDENRAFKNSNHENAVYTIQEVSDDNPTNLEDRMKQFAPDDSDGIDKEVIQVAGQDALRTHEPVNEIDDYNIYFYKDGVEHCINFETPFGKNEIEDYTQELINGIQK